MDEYSSTGYRLVSSLVNTHWLHVVKWLISQSSHIQLAATEFLDSTAALSYVYCCWQIHLKCIINLSESLMLIFVLGLNLLPGNEFSTAVVFTQAPQQLVLKTKVQVNDQSPFLIHEYCVYKMAAHSIIPALPQSNTLC